MKNIVINRAIKEYKSGIKVAYEARSRNDGNHKQNLRDMFIGKYYSTRNLIQELSRDMSMIKENLELYANDVYDEEFGGE